MNTAIYIDGYNLYYGLLKNTKYKWLNLYSLLSEIIKIQNPQSDIVAIKYFTAPVISRFSQHKEKAQQSQNYYHKALCVQSDNCIKIINGYFDIDVSSPILYRKPIDLKAKSEVWKLEEKQTDVNIALEMYRDASIGEVQQQILVSSDSDLIPALKYIRNDFKSIVLGLVLPRSNDHGRANKGLSEFTDWTRSHIKTEELEKHQFPEMIPTNKKPIYKPNYW